MSKVLFVATVVKGHISKFHIPYLKMFQEAGWETAVAARNDYESSSDCKIPFCDTYYDVLFERSPFKIANIKAFLRLKEIVEQGEYDIIHCHTPVGAILTRLAAIKARKQGTKVFYTAHGFHFYKGAPLKNWLLYFPAEWLCAHFTDVLVTINQEDYALAQKHMKAKKVAYVPGVGIDLKRFTDISVDREKKREELGVPSDAILLLSVGDLNKNKNHQIIIRAMACLNNPKIKYIIAGTGEEAERLVGLAKSLGLENRVVLLGYRTDIADLCYAADIFCFPSYREGLGLAAIEAMACGLKVIAAENRGTREFIFSGKNGILCQAGDMRGFAEAIDYVMRGEVLANAENNMETLKVYSVEYVISAMRRLYLAEMES